MGEQYNVTPEQRRLLENRAKRRLELRNEFLKQTSNPFRSAAEDGGYLVSVFSSIMSDITYISEETAALPRRTSRCRRCHCGRASCYRVTQPLYPLVYTFLFVILCRCVVFVYGSRDAFLTFRGGCFVSILNAGELKTDCGGNINVLSASLFCVFPREIGY